MRTIISAAFMLLAATLPASAQGAAPPDVLKDLAPTGKLRAAINFGNGVLAQKGAERRAEGHHARSRRARSPSASACRWSSCTFEAAGKVFEGAKAGAWDIGFVAIEPVRAAEIEFTAPYVIIDGTYMVRKDLPLKEVGDVDKPGIRIAVGARLGLRPLSDAHDQERHLVRAKVGGGRAMIEMFVDDKLEAAAGVRQPLEDYAKDHPEMRVMSGAFQQIQQAMGTPKGRDGAGAAYLAAFVEEMKASGFVADALKRSGQVAQVAPPAK